MENSSHPFSNLKSIYYVIAIAGVFASVVGTYWILSYRVASIEAQMEKHGTSIAVLNSEANKASKDIAVALEKLDSKVEVKTQSLESKLEATKSGVEKLVQSSMVTGGVPAKR